MQGEVMKKAKQEKRRSLRIKTEVIVRYKVLSVEQQKLLCGMKRIEGSGVCLVADWHLEPGTVLMIEMKSSPGTGPALNFGSVVWSKASMLGPGSTGRARFDNGVVWIELNEADSRSLAERVKSEDAGTKAEGWKTGIFRDLSKREKK
jgi:hypothetical protein